MINLGFKLVCGEVCGGLWCGLWWFVVVCGGLWCLVPPFKGGSFCTEFPFSDSFSAN